jgi:hypothetical protein
MKSYILKTAGFTLIEVILYLGLFALLITGAITAAFAIQDGSESNKTRVVLQAEGAFLLAKVHYAIVNGTDPLQDLHDSLVSIHNVIIYNATSTNFGISFNSVGVSFTLNSLTHTGRVISQTFFSTTTVNQ